MAWYNSSPHSSVNELDLSFVESDRAGEVDFYMNSFGLSPITKGPGIACGLRTSGGTFHGLGGSSMYDIDLSLNDLEDSPIKEKSSPFFRQQELESIKRLFSSRGSSQAQNSSLVRYPSVPTKSPIIGRIRKIRIEHVTFLCSICKKNDHKTAECRLLCRKNVCRSFGHHHKKDCTLTGTR
jgi:hypothetical protein